MQNDLFKKLLPWGLAILLFLLIAFLFFSPIIEGKKLQQNDIAVYKGASKEIADFRQTHHEEPLWTNSMFSGMPAYQISTLYHGNLIKKLDKLFQLWLPQPANFIFLYAIGFFILLMVLGINPWAAVAGALAFAFSSYFFIIIEAGHNTKAIAIGYMAPVLAGIILSFRGKYLWGGLLTALFLSLQIAANHLQITYYLLIIILLLGLAELVTSLRERQLKRFLMAVGITLVAALVAIGPNISSLWTTYEYTDATTRGKSELTLNKANQTSGLDRDYITSWSYGVDETFTLLIPNFKGGASTTVLSKNSELYDALKNQNLYNADEVIKVPFPTYWGSQPNTSGPVYVGAVIAMLFILGLFIVKGPLKWWLLAATLLSVLLSWGHNFNAFTNFFLDYMPGYNKFRAVSMILVIAELCMPLLAIFAVQKILDNDSDKAKTFNAVKIAVIISGGIALFFALFPGMLYSFIPPGGEQLSPKVYPQDLIGLLTSTLPIDRQSMMTRDAFRSLAFILLAGLALWALLFKKLDRKYIMAGLILLILIDLWAVDKRYLHNEKFVSKSRVMNPFPATQADQMIMADKDPDFKVMNLAVNTFNDASTSYYHKSIGGYHGAKLKRYQELIEFQMYDSARTGLNLPVVNMLNTKYVIVPDQNEQPLAQLNRDALGHAWFVPQYKLVTNADSELVALGHFDPSVTAIIDQRFKALLAGYVPGQADSLDSIRLVDYKPNHLVYEYKVTKPQLAIFSEIYYDKGWNAYIDGKPVPHFRANYVLRAMVLPPDGKKLEFRFQPRSYYAGEKISYAFSYLMILLLLGGLGFSVKKYLDAGRKKARG